jgi:hypothetical protein
MDKRQFAKQRNFSYIEQIIALIPHDKHIYLTFVEVAQMLRNPLSLVHPRILMKMLVNLFFQRYRRNEIIDKKEEAKTVLYDC